MEDTKYDIIIIGSGLGGLECAVILSREGYKVLVLEKNKQIGGNLQIFSREKRIFDTGIHYIGGLEPGQNLYHYFKYLGIMDDLKLKKLDEEGFDIVTFDGDDTEYRYAQGYDRFIETMCGYFPEEREGIIKYCDIIKEVCGNFPMYNLKPSQGDWNYVKYHDISAREFIESCTTNKKLQAVLAGSNLLYAGEADKTPLYTHALIINSYIESSYRCIDGGSQIAILLSRIIRNNGGTILKHTEAKQFIFEGENISAVEVADGRRFYGKHFISNVHPTATLEMVEEGKIRNAYRKRIASLENSISVFIVYLVLKKNFMKYFNHNYYHYIDPDVWAGPKYTNEWPPNYAVFTGASSRANGYTDAITLMAYMHYSETLKWADSYNVVSKEQDRGADYEAFKNEKAEILINEAEKKFPGLRDNIESYYTSSPLTYRDYIGSKDGSLYGVTKDYKNPMKSFISPRTKIPNLLLTGQNLNLHGVLGVTIGAVITSSVFLGHQYIMDKVNETAG